jgi:hypothetical protein
MNIEFVILIPFNNATKIIFLFYDVFSDIPSCIANIFKAYTSFITELTADI